MDNFRKRIHLLRLAPFLEFEKRHPQDVMPPLPLAYTAAILKNAAYDVALTDTWAHVMDFDTLFENLIKQPFDVLLVDFTTPVAQMARRLVMRLKEARSFTAIASGQHAAALPEHVLSDASPFDFCIRSEIEIALPQLLEALTNEKPYDKLAGLAFCAENGEMVLTSEREVLIDLDSLPSPDWSLFNLDSYVIHSAVIPSLKPLKWGFLLAGRGCPYACIYCSSTLRQSYGTRVRLHSAQRVVDEIENLIALGRNAFFFEDDTFSFDRDWVLALCDEIRSRGLRIKWAVQTRADRLDAELAREMRKAGCCAVTMGIESGSERILKLMKKGEDKAQMRRAVKAAKDAGLLTTLFFMLGNPTESESEIRKTFRFMKELSPFMIQVAFFTPYPGSSFYATERPDIDFSRLSHYNDLPANVSRVSDERLKYWQSRFYRSHYFSPSFISRYLRHRAVAAVINPSERELLIKASKYILGMGRNKSQS